MRWLRTHFRMVRNNSFTSAEAPASKRYFRPVIEKLETRMPLDAALAADVQAFENGSPDLDQPNRAGIAGFLHADFVDSVDKP